MNEKAKKMIEQQNERLYNTLKDTFNLPVYQDSVADDERPNKLNLFLLIFGDWSPGESEQYLTQDIIVTYLSEDSETLETDALDIISSISSINLINFHDSNRDRVQKKDTEEYVDRLTFIFKRGIKYECPI
ncbi:hypothetical protein ACFFGV_19555 [Pontibacillus salicampi]|uniref:DUF3168 domain-containing protein n=1 Tax=Pontibacillus salicampi TaxID=1449801 RepID=A0ABV6LU40_9BACI